MSELNKSIWIDAEPEVVFSYFTEADKMEKWCGKGAEVDAVPQGLYRLDMGDAGIMVGRFVRVESPTFISWEVDPPEGVDLSPTLIEVSFSPEAGGCRVDVRHTGLQSPFDAVAVHGWDHHLARLSVAATGGDPGRDSLCSRSLETLT